MFLHNESRAFCILSMQTVESGTIQPCIDNSVYHGMTNLIISDIGAASVLPLFLLLKHSFEMGLFDLHV